MNLHNRNFAYREGSVRMFPRFALLMAVPLALLCPAFANAQSAAPANAAPAPPRDLSGIWQPVRSIEGIQPNGALNMPADGRPEHDLHLTPYGKESRRRTSRRMDRIRFRPPKKTIPDILANRKDFRARICLRFAPRRSSRIRFKS